MPRVAKTCRNPGPPLLRPGNATGDRGEAFLRLLDVPVLDSLSYPVETFFRRGVR